MRRLGVVFGVCASLATSATVAFATPPSFAPLVDFYARTGPLRQANSGRKTPVTVRLDGSASSLGALEVAPGVGVRWVAPDEAPSFLAAASDAHPWVSPPLHLLLDRSGNWTHASDAHAMGRRGAGVVVGIIDTGLDFTHPDLRDQNGKTRVAWMLDLGAAAAAGLHPELEATYGCTTANQPPCAIYSGDDIEAMRAAHADLPHDYVGHGTHVASIAAGNGGLDATGKPQSAQIGVAPDATLIVVRVTRGAADEAITDADVLNAVRFVFDRAADMGMPAVVNLSLGGDYGPHDGTSPLEAGLAAFVGPDHPGRAVVVAAGNSAGIFEDDAGMQYGVHTEVRVLPEGTARAILTTPVVGSPVRGTAFVWITYRQGDEISVGVEKNGVLVLDGRGANDEAVTADGVVPTISVINGVAPKSPVVPGSYGAVVAVDGEWTSGDQFAITLEGHGVAQLWVQGAGDAEYGSQVGGELFLNPLKLGTINVPASAPDLIAVGCTVNRLAWPTVDGTEVQIEKLGPTLHPTGDSACYFSSAGPTATGVAKPEISAPGAFVAAAMSTDADPGANPQSMFVPPAGRCPGGGTRCYVLPDQRHAIASGTSMSAPHVAGGAALLFEQDPTLTEPQIVALLQGGSRRFKGLVPLDYQLGPGALDVVGSFTALMEEGAPPMTSPDATQSWVELSTGYARPDPTWPIVGTVLVRDSNGKPADGFDPSALTLVTENAVVLEPLHRLAPGLFRFQIAGADGTGGELLHVAVRWGSSTIADRTLPIGGDVWQTRDVAEARGGCSVASRSTRSSPFFALAIAALAARTRRLIRAARAERAARRA